MNHACTPTADTLYHYPASVSSVYDGDTVRASIEIGVHDLGMDDVRMRLARIDAPEVRGIERPQGLVARDFLRELIDGRDVIVQNLAEQVDPWGRLIVEVWIDDVNVSDHMVENGHAHYEVYR